MKKYKYLVLAVLFFGLAWFCSAVLSDSFLASHQIKRFQKRLDKKEALVDKVAKNVLSHPSDTMVTHFKRVDYYDTYQKKGIAFYFYKNNDLVYWNTNRLSLPDEVKHNENFLPVTLKNGFYLEKYFQKGNIKVVAYILIKNQFVHNNKYLKSSYFKDWGLSDDISLETKSSDKNSAVKNQSGQAVFYLNGSTYNSATFQYVRSLFYLISAMFFLFFFRELCFRVFNKSLYNFFLLLALVVFVRFLCLEYSFPDIFYKLNLFAPALYAQANLQPSLGDFLINVLLAFYLVYVFFVFVELKPLPKRIRALLINILLWIVLIFLAQVIAFLTKGLVINSKISFNLSNYLQLSVYSYLAIFIVGLMMLTYFLLADKILKITAQYKLHYLYEILALAVIALVFHFIGFNLFDSREVLFTFWCLPVLATILFVKRVRNNLYGFGGIAVLLIFFAAFTAFSLSTWTAAKTLKDKKNIAQKLSDDHDPVAEFVFASIEKKIQSDKYLQRNETTYWKNKNKIDGYIIKHYFTGFWNKYDIRITLCRRNDSMVVNPGNILVNCRQYFLKQIHSGDSTSTPGLYFINKSESTPIYLAEIELNKLKKAVNQDTTTAFVEFYPKYLNHSEGYPELLLDKKELEQTIVSGKYDYAKYRNGELVSLFGDFNYPVSPDIFLSKDSVNAFHQIDFQNYKHLVYDAGNSIVVISSPISGMFDFSTMFSNIFALFSALLFVIMAFFGKQQPFNAALFLKSFNSKLQLFMLGIIFFAILLFGIGTGTYIKRQYENKNKNTIAEKTRSIMYDLSGRIGNQDSLTTSMNNFITYNLVQLSNVFYTDINLYDAEGNLISTSRPEIFNIGLLSDDMNSKAYKEMRFHKKTQYIHKEQIGKLHYLSAYVPFYNVSGKFLAYLNLPYFTKQNELENEISVFLSALINVYVLLFLLSITVAFVFANFLSKPLRLIKNKIASIEIGKSNELIEWEADDEIGSLVKEYNRMVVELQANIDLLARAERESAWREMAKQVAHEIKNPLTPMKLSIQHLKRSFDDGAPDLDKRIEKTSKVLVEQIETLAHIADEFSNFAKMPRAQKATVSAESVLHQSFDLYKETERIEFKYDVPTEAKEWMIFADKDQLIRVFNNLIKNAIQAVEDCLEKKISVAMKKEEDALLISIADTGLGISKALQEKIFTPNFTTKSTGMGLGLAMVKNIVHNSGGEVWFKTKENEGTTFFVKLPVATEQ